MMKGSLAAKPDYGVLDYDYPQDSGHGRGKEAN